jgi:hypothetical protein
MTDLTQRTTVIKGWDTLTRLTRAIEGMEGGKAVVQSWPKNRWQAPHKDRSHLTRPRHKPTLAFTLTTNLRGYYCAFHGPITTPQRERFLAALDREGFTVTPRSSMPDTILILDKET